MTAHKHAEMIKAKADNVELAVFTKIEGEWFSIVGFPEWINEEYFVCLPRNKDACLHWLNGGDIEGNTDYGFELCGRHHGVHQPWAIGTFLMNEENEFRIRPTKEKRWIAVEPKSGNVYGMYKRKGDCERAFIGLQILEIEVEV